MIKLIRQESFSIADLIVYLNEVLYKGLEDGSVKHFAEMIVAENPGKDPIFVLHDWVQKHMKYVHDELTYVENGEIIKRTDVFISPAKQVEFYLSGKEITGDCDDIALMLTAMYISLGYDAHIVLLDTQNQDFDHAVTMINYRGMTIYADASSKFPVGWIEKYFQKIII